MKCNIVKQSTFVPKTLIRKSSFDSRYCQTCEHVGIFPIFNNCQILHDFETYPLSVAAAIWIVLMEASIPSHCNKLRVRKCIHSHPLPYSAALSPFPTSINGERCLEIIDAVINHPLDKSGCIRIFLIGPLRALIRRRHSKVLLLFIYSLRNKKIQRVYENRNFRSNLLLRIAV